MEQLEIEMPEPEWKPNPNEPFQVMRPHTDEEYEALKASIQQHGIRQPIELDPQGNILDGHYRFRISQEMGVLCPFIVVDHLKSDQEKRDYARQVNCARRSPGIEEKKRIAREMLLEEPQPGVRHIARVVGVSHDTVRRLRSELEAIGRIVHVAEETTATEEETEPRFPFLETPAWEPWHKMEALHLLARIDDGTQKTVKEIMGDRERHPKDALRMIEAVALFGEKDRKRLIALWERGDSKAKSLVASKLTGGMPAPDPRISLLVGAVQEVRRAMSLTVGEAPDELTEAVETISGYIRFVQANEEVW